jgi:hypothetical protein
MKNIEDAAHEYADDKNMNIAGSRVIETFKAGVEFAQQWIPLDEEPEFEKWIIVKNDNAYAAAKISAEIDVKFLKSNFTHWRPIELK